MEEVVILDAKRTPIGKFGGTLSGFSAVDLGVIAAKGVIKASGVEPEQIDQAIFGNVLQAGSGQNVARQIALKSGMPFTSTAMTVNEVCGSGMKAIQLGQQALSLNQAKMVLVGGTESMSNAPMLVNNRFGHKYGDLNMVDSLAHDGLMDAFSEEPMGITGENVAERFNVSREAQDQLAYESQQEAAQATENHVFDDEIIPIEVKQRKQTIILNHDESIRPSTTTEVLGKLRPSFKTDGTVTAGNASPMNDGASAMILMRKSDADDMGLNYIAVIKDVAEVGVDPAIMGYAPFDAINKVLKQSNISKNDIDLFEINEAFASQSVAVVRDLAIDRDKVNVSGGAIALGHPLGATGARIVTTLIHNLKYRDQHTGIASLCIGGGLGLAMLLEVKD